MVMQYSGPLLSLKPRWPAYIYNPSRLTEKLKQKALPVAGKKHTVMYFGSKDFGFVTPNQIRTPFEDFVEEFSQQKISKKDLTWFERAIPEARAELAKPKEDRMFIPRSQRKRKASSGTKKKSPAPQKPTPKKAPVKAKPAEPEPESDEPKSEEEVEEEGDEEEEEEEVISEEESEAEFDESPKKAKTPSKKEKRPSEKPKKDKVATAKTPKDESLSTAELVDRYRVKSYPEDASKKVILRTPLSLTVPRHERSPSSNQSRKRCPSLQTAPPKGNRPRRSLRSPHRPLMDLQRRNPERTLPRANRNPRRRFVVATSLLLLISFRSGRLRRKPRLRQRENESRSSKSQAM
jgi:chemotaxis protein histidine kinase CheA